MKLYSLLPQKGRSVKFLGRGKSVETSQHRLYCIQTSSASSHLSQTRKIPPLSQSVERKSFYFRNSHLNMVVKCLNNAVF